LDLEYLGGEMETGLALVTRINTNGVPEAYVLHFVGEPRVAFQTWLGRLEGKDPVDLPSRVPMGGKTFYDADIEANTVIVYTHKGRQQIYAYQVGDFEFRAWLQMAEDQEWGIAGSGRRAKFAQSLSTWRKWAKKEGTVI
jgi:hypothetical protein